VDDRHANLQALLSDSLCALVGFLIVTKVPVLSLPGKASTLCFFFPILFSRLFGAFPFSRVLIGKMNGGFTRGFSSTLTVLV